MRLPVRSHHPLRAQELVEDVQSTQRRQDLRQLPASPVNLGQTLKILGRARLVAPRLRRGLGSWMRLAQARAKPRGKEDPWHATTASASLILSAYARPSVEPAKPKQDRGAKLAMGLGMTLQCAPPRVEARLVSAHRRAKAKERKEASRGAKARAKVHSSGAKDPMAKAKARFQPLMKAIGASSHLKEEGHGTNGARSHPVKVSGQEQLLLQSPGCRQLHRRLGQEQRPSRLGQERLGPARRQAPSAR